MICVRSLQNNHHVDNISAKMSALRGKVSELERAAAQRKAKLDENSAFLQFNWKADVVESWIGMNTLKSLFAFNTDILPKKFVWKLNEYTGLSKVF